jgi:hypothetical protein
MAAWVVGSTIYQALVLGLPRAEVMGGIGALALVANLASLLLLMRYKDGDANVRSVWICSRNDAVGNVVVMAAAIGVWSMATAWPDFVVAALMGGLFLTSSVRILRQAWTEYRREEIVAPGPPDGRSDRNTQTRAAAARGLGHSDDVSARIPTVPVRQPDVGIRPQRNFERAASQKP